MSKVLLLLFVAALDAAAAPGVKGHYQEVNSGNFDVVDGIAASLEGGTRFYVTEKPIASAALANSACALAQARALIALRNSGYIVASLTVNGNPLYFEAGTPHGGKRIVRLIRQVKASGGKVKDGRIAGSVTEKGHAEFAFDLAVAKETQSRTPTQAESVAAYEKAHRAALARDYAAMLAAQGFDAPQVEAVRKLPGIEADLAAQADRFLRPGVAEEFWPEKGLARVGAKGATAKGAKFVNFYQFETCGDKLVMTGIGENPQ